MPSTTSKKKPKDHQAATSKKAYGNSWKTPLTDLELPSGELCQVRRPGVQGLIKAGVLHSLDSLTSIVNAETIPNAKGLPKQSVKSILQDPEKFQAMMDQVDKIVVYVVVQPDVLPAIVTQSMVGEKFSLDDVGRDLTDEERDPEAIYVDYIDPQDKMFIMNFAVGGSRDLEKFRKDSEALVGGVSAGEDPQDPS